MVKEFVVKLAVDLVGPPAQSIRAVVVADDLWFSSKNWETQDIF